MNVQAHDSEILCLEYSKPETGVCVCVCVCVWVCVCVRACHLGTFKCVYSGREPMILAENRCTECDCKIICVDYFGRKWLCVCECLHMYAALCQYGVCVCACVSVCVYSK